MRNTEPRRSAPNYTNAALAMGLVNLLWMFIALWAWQGFGAVIVVGIVLNMLIDRLEERRRRS
ncbi:MAG: hypothetical protein AAGB05_02995 [Pseudomonadota bacterium]